MKILIYLPDDLDSIVIHATKGKQNLESEIQIKGRVKQCTVCKGNYLSKRKTQEYCSEVCKNHKRLLTEMRVLRDKTKM